MYENAMRRGPVAEAGCRSHVALALLSIGILDGVIIVDIDESDDLVVTALKGVTVRDSILEEDTRTSPFPGVRTVLDTPGV
jgi:hypothetical protein